MLAHESPITINRFAGIALSLVLRVVGVKAEIGQLGLGFVRNINVTAGGVVAVSVPYKLLDSFSSGKQSNKQVVFFTHASSIFTLEAQFTYDTLE